MSIKSTMLSLTEENYLKAIYHLSHGGTNAVTTNAIAESLNTKAASVTDMLKKLSGKNLVSYEPYYGVKILKQGKTEALMIIRKHRLWETFLVQKLHFAWDEVHDVAEQLEHIQSGLLIEKLDEFLGYPDADPHGHPIPDKHGKINQVRQTPLCEIPVRSCVVVQSVKDGSPSFLQYLSKNGVYIGAGVVILDKVEFDGSLELLIDDERKIFISRDAAKNLLVTHEG